MKTNGQSTRSSVLPVAALALAIGGLLATPHRCGAQEVARLEALPMAEPPQDRTDFGMGVTNDGVVVGNVQFTSGITRAIRWPVSGVGVGLGVLPGAHSSFAWAVSDDGSIVVGECLGATGPPAFRWTAATGIASLPPLSENTGGSARGISANGAFIAGSGAASGSPGWSRAARWNAELEPSDLGFLSASLQASVGQGISADGRVVVGSSYASPTEVRAIRWKAGIMTDLGELAELDGGGVGRAASGDGEIVVGYVDATPSNRAWRWTVASGMNALPRVDVSSEFTRAFDISDDGRVIVGWEGSSVATHEACIWIAGEPFDLKTLLSSKYGLDVANWTLLSANGVSPDGRYVTGEAIFDGESVAFRVYLPNEAPIARAGRNVVVTTKASASGSTVATRSIPKAPR